MFQLSKFRTFALVLKVLNAAIVSVKVNASMQLLRLSSVCDNEDRYPLVVCIVVIHCCCRNNSITFSFSLISLLSAS